MMQILSEKEIVSLIRRHKPFDATLENMSFRMTINEYVPYIATAIHSGSNVEKTVESQYLISKVERYYEEDPFTDQFIAGLPITIKVYDSRYSYDLNRSPKTCIYETAWHKSVWNIPLTKMQKKLILERHATYYRIISVLLRELETMFPQCYVFDIHSYNYQRITDTHTPVFNIGCHFIDKKSWSHFLDHIHTSLSAIELPNIDADVKNDLVFEGKGYQAQYIKQHFENILTIPIEIKKIYMDELTGEPYPLVIEALSEGIQSTIKSEMDLLTHKNILIKRTEHKITDPAVFQIDKRLFQSSKKIDVLYYVNPINFQTEKKKFFQKKFNYTPQFKYRQLKIDPYTFRENLYKLPVSSINSPILRQLYREVIDSIALDIDLITSIGSDKFFYNSLRIYGEPNNRDINNAKFLLHASILEQDKNSLEVVDRQTITTAFNEAIDYYGIPFSIKISDQIIAKAMVDNIKKEVIINKNAAITRQELNALIHHEVGVHALTTMNASAQPLSLLSLGLPNNTHTQEGLAIFSEHLSGNFTVKRFHELSLRVIAVEHMIKYQDFPKTFNYLSSIYNLDVDDCFRLVSRVYRGGGFTKDFLYLNGLRDIVNAYKKEDIRMLFSGKTSLPYLNVLVKLKDEGWFIEPKVMPTSYLSPDGNKNSNVIEYLMHSIK